MPASDCTKPRDGALTVSNTSFSARSWSAVIVHRGAESFARRLGSCAESPASRESEASFGIGEMSPVCERARGQWGQGGRSLQTWPTSLSHVERAYGPFAWMGSEEWTGTGLPTWRRTYLGIIVRRTVTHRWRLGASSRQANLDQHISAETQCVVGLWDAAGQKPSTSQPFRSLLDD